jgi:prepilin-type processing-associated H-X9-DG protein
MVLVLLARAVQTCKQVLFLVQPETLLRWHREGFRWFWKRKSQGTSPTPKLAPEIIIFIKEMAKNNQLWGSRMHPWGGAQAGYARVEADHPEIDECARPNILYVDGHSGVTNLLAIPAEITYPDKGTYCTSMPTNKISIKGANMENATTCMPGMEMTSTTFGGKGVRRRVWEELSSSVLVCKEEDQRGRKEHDEPVD